MGGWQVWCGGVGLNHGPIDVWNNNGISGCILQICQGIIGPVAHLHEFLLLVICRHVLGFPATSRHLQTWSLHTLPLTANLATGKLQLERLIFGNSWLMISARFALYWRARERFRLWNLFRQPLHPNGLPTGCQPAANRYAGSKPNSKWFAGVADDAMKDTAAFYRPCWL